MSEFRPSARVVTQAISRTRIRIFEFATVGSVGASTLTTILTFTPTENVTIGRISAGGEDYAKFEWFIDTVRFETKRSGPDRYVDFFFPVHLTLDAGETLEVKVTHFHTGDTLAFEASIAGFEA